MKQLIYAHITNNADEICEHVNRLFNTNTLATTKGKHGEFITLYKQYKIITQYHEGKFHLHIFKAENVVIYETLVLKKRAIVVKGVNNWQDLPEEFNVLKLDKMADVFTTDHRTDIQRVMLFDEKIDLGAEEAMRIIALNDTLIRNATMSDAMDVLLAICLANDFTDMTSYQAMFLFGAFASPDVMSAADATLSDVFSSAISQLKYGKNESLRNAYDALGSERNKRMSIQSFIDSLFGDKGNDSGYDGDNSDGGDDNE